MQLFFVHTCGVDTSEISGPFDEVGLEKDIARIQALPAGKDTVRIHVYEVEANPVVRADDRQPSDQRWVQKAPDDVWGEEVGA